MGCPMRNFPNAETTTAREPVGSITAVTQPTACRPCGLADSAVEHDLWWARAAGCGSAEIPQNIWPKI